MEFLADPSQISTVEQRRENAQQTSRNQPQTLCKTQCCSCLTPTSLRCMGICFTGTLLLIIGTVMIALYFSGSQAKTYLIPALVLFVLGVIFISIAEWFCRVKVYHRYGQNHQRTLERLSGIERRLNSRPGSMPEIADEPPPYHNNPFVQQRIPEVVISTPPVESTTDNPDDARPSLEESTTEEVPSYSITISNDVLPSYNEATSSNYGIGILKKEDEEYETAS